LQSNAGKSLARRLCQLNPAIWTNFEAAKEFAEEVPFWWTPTGVYSVAFCSEALRRVKEGGTISAVAREMGCPPRLLNEWIKQAEAGKGARGM
jgi:hypothetical protein